MGLPKKRIEKGIFPVSDSLTGGLAQLARALDLHSRGQGFDSLILHKQQLEGFLKKLRELDKWWVKKKKRALRD